MFLTSACKYGIQASIFLSMNESNNYVSIKQIAREFTIPFHFLTKVLQQLTQAGIITSTKGAKGGVRLAKDPDSIRLYDIISIIDGESDFNECLLGLPGCGLHTPCPAHDMWSNIRSQYIKSARSITLKELAQDTKKFNLRLGK